MSITGLQSLDPEIALKAKQIQGMPPDKAIQFLLQNGVSSQVAGMVMKNMMMKKMAAAQGSPGQSTPPPKTVSQELDDKVNAAAAQHSRGQGLAGLPVNSDMFNDQPQGMKGGGIVAFDDGGYISGPPMGAPGNISPTDYGAMQQYAIAQAMASQQQQAQAQQAAQAQAQASQSGLAGLAGGGIVAFDEGGTADADQIDPQTGMRLGDFENIPAESPFNMRKIFSALSPYQNKSPVGVAPPEVGPPSSLGTPPTQGPPSPGMVAPAAQIGPQSAAAQPPRPMPVPPQQGGGQGMGMRAGVGIPQNMQDERAQMQAGLAKLDPNAPGNTAEDILAKNVDMANSQGIGAAAASHLQDLAQRKEALQTYAQQGKWLALAQAGFAMASAATQNPHGGFLGALAVGGQKGAEEYGKTIAQYHSSLANVQDLSYQVAQSQENLKYDQTKTAQKQHQDIVDRYDKAFTQMNDQIYKSDALVNSKEIAQIYSRSAADNAYKGPASDVYLREWQKSFMIQNHRLPTPEEIGPVMRQIYGNTAAVQGADARAAASVTNAQTKAQATAQEVQAKMEASPQFAMTVRQALKGDPTSIALINAQHPGFLDSLRQQGPAQGQLPPGWSVTPR